MNYWNTDDGHTPYLEPVKITKDDFVLDEVTFFNTHIDPIPLTPKILEKNGFRLTTFEGKLGKYWEIPEFVMGEFGQTSIGQNNIQINYVHELQHAFRLCKIDKTIEL